MREVLKLRQESCKTFPGRIANRVFIDGIVSGSAFVRGVGITGNAAFATTAITNVRLLCQFTEVYCIDRYLFRRQFRIVTALTAPIR